MIFLNNSWSLKLLAIAAAVINFSDCQVIPRGTTRSSFPSRPPTVRPPPATIRPPPQTQAPPVNTRWPISQQPTVCYGGVGTCASGICCQAPGQNYDICCPWSDGACCPETGYCCPNNQAQCAVGGMFCAVIYDARTGFIQYDYKQIGVNPSKKK